MAEPGKLIKEALTDAEDRQRALNDVCRRVLADFVGRPPTPELVLEAETQLRAAIDESIREGKYVLPDGLLVDYIKLGDDMRLKVFFKKAKIIIKRD